MRLWHKDLIEVLPRQQLLGQWRECCLIAKSIAEKGTPNHILVNPVMDYPLGHFYAYTLKVYKEMRKRGYRPEWEKFTRWLPDTIGDIPNASAYIFTGWHNEKYLMQCLANLEEKHDRGGIFDEEWDCIRRSAAFIFLDYRLNGALKIL